MQYDIHVPWIAIDSKNSVREYVIRNYYIQNVMWYL